jgi:hypothetical protein
MTRGREANHAFVATDGHDETGRPSPAHDGSSEKCALDVLAAALARSGAQDAAHTARDNARTRAVEAARRAAEQTTRKAAEPAVPDEHTARPAELRQRQIERERLAGKQQEHRQAAAKTRVELARTTRLRPGRRRELLEAAARDDRAAQTASPRLATLDREIAALSRQVAADTREREREADRRTRTARPLRAASDQPALAAPLPVELIRRAALASAAPTRRDQPGVAPSTGCGRRAAHLPSRRRADPGIGW